MTKKMSAIVLLATALPFSQAKAHSVSLKGAPIDSYLYFMLAIGAAYLLFLLIRMQRRKEQD